MSDLFSVPQLTSNTFLRDRQTLAKETRRVISMVQNENMYTIIVEATGGRILHLCSAVRPAYLFRLFKYSAIRYTAAFTDTTVVI